MIWRGLITSLISRQGISSRTGNGMEGRVSECNQKILAVVRPLTSKDGRAQLKEDLEAVLLQTVQLSQTLRCQKTSWSIRHSVPPQAASCGSSVLLNPLVMEDKHVDDDGDSDEGPSKYQSVRSWLEKAKHHEKQSSIPNS